MRTFTDCCAEPCFVVGDDLLYMQRRQKVVESKVPRVENADAVHG
jgi:hypothetical protein